jgi:hypothetical protein
MTPEETLLKAAEDIGEHGHNKQTYFGGNGHWSQGPACAFGAIARTQPERYMRAIGNGGFVLNEEVEKSAAAKLLAEQIRRDYPDLIPNNDGADFLAVIQYNDHPSTSAEDVILTMKKAAHHG